MWHSTYSGCFSLCCYWWGYLLKKKVRVVTDRRDNMSLLVDKKILLWGTRRSVRCTVCYQDGSHRPSIIIVRRRRRRRRRRVVALRCTVPPVVCLDPVNHWYCQYAIRIPTLLVLGLVISNIHQHTVWLQRYRRYNKQRTDKHSLIVLVITVTLTLIAAIQSGLWWHTYHQTKFGCKRISSSRNIVETTILWLYEPTQWPRPSR